MNHVSKLLAAAALLGAQSVMAQEVAPTTSQPMTAPGPEGDLAGTLIPPAADGPVVIIIPGSGPTDRDGNNPMGLNAGTYRLLGEGLAKDGIGTLRIDKRGMFGSAGAVSDPNAVTIGDYASDVQAWKVALLEKTGADCVWLAGHSEGGLVALTAAQDTDGICGVILLASVGRPLGTILREQFTSNPANAPLLPDAMKVLDALEAGSPIDVSGMHPAMQGIFAPPVQGFIIDALSRDPAALAAATALPLLIIQGDADIQVALADANALHAAQPESTLVILPGVNHVLKTFEGETREANIASYSDPELPIARKVVANVADFVLAEHGED